MKHTNFTDLDLIAPLQLALKESGYETPTPIQAQAIPLILQGHDLLGIAQTGTGKTAAFCLPLLQILSSWKTRPEPKSPRALILTPTRELAVQIHQSLVVYGKHLRLRHGVIFGGVGQGTQVRDLQGGLDVLVATPGRLLDLMQQGYLKLDKVQNFILDEADRMLDMGFLPDIKRILPLLPKTRHNLFFSATMPPEIQKLSHSILRTPKTVEVTPISTTAEKVEQSVMYVEKANKLDLLLHLLEDNDLFKVLVFVEMKHGANKVVDKLTKSNVTAAAIHGDKSQNARQRAIEDFRSDKIRVLVATDIASRGIDIDGITHVINFELPHIPESYVHRIGRTARAGASGKAISFSTGEEKSFLFAIEKTTRQPVEVIREQPFHSDTAEGTPIVSLGKAKAVVEARRQEVRKQRRGSGDRRGAPASGGGPGGPRRGGPPKKKKKTGGPFMGNNRGR